MNTNSQVGVYKLYKLARLEGSKFDVETKKLERDNHVILHDYANKINSQSEINGQLYELDEEATKLHLEGKDFLKKDGVVAEDENEEEAPSLEDLKAEYLRLTGEDAKGNWGVKKLTEEIAALKAVEVN